MANRLFRFLARSVVFAVACAVTPAAQAAPDLSNQSGWGEAEKKEFLDFLDTGRGAPIEGQVQEVSVAGEPPTSYPRGYGRRPFYLTLEAASGMVMTRAQEGSPTTQGFGIGPRLIAGWHLFSWVRYWVGAEYSEFSSVGHAQIPIGVELALIPLGAPHTQYFVLRGGMTGHYFSAGQGAASGLRPLDGIRTSWDLALGYEWQLAESHFRFHALADSKFGLNSSTAGFYSLGLSAGFSYMF